MPVSLILLSLPRARFTYCYFWTTCETVSPSNDSLNLIPTFLTNATISHDRVIPLHFTITYHSFSDMSSKVPFT